MVFGGQRDEVVKTSATEADNLSLSPGTSQGRRQLSPASCSLIPTRSLRHMPPHPTPPPLYVLVERKHGSQICKTMDKS